MPDQTRIVKPFAPQPKGHDHARATKVRMLEGYVLPVPEGWALLKPGDAALTRRVKQGGPHWVMEEKKGRRTFSLGVWAPKDRIEQLQSERAQEKQDPKYQKQLQQGRDRRAKAEESYGQDFQDAIVAYLNFAPAHAPLAATLAKAVAEHATPVGSGTVARTKRIPIEERAQAAVIAWMRHHTTDYDRMHIPRVKGKRREVRRRLAKQSVTLLNQYRTSGSGSGSASENGQQVSCVLTAALKQTGHLR